MISVPYHQSMTEIFHSKYILMLCIFMLLNACYIAVFLAVFLAKIKCSLLS